MLQIRPVSEVQDNFSDIEKCVQNGDSVLLTKNGISSMVVMSAESYLRLVGPEECLMDITDSFAESSDVRLTHDEVFEGLRKKING